MRPKGYEADCWTDQQIMADQHLRICNLERRIIKLRKQRDDLASKVVLEHDCAQACGSLRVGGRV